MKIVIVGSINELGGIQKHIELLCQSLIIYQDIELHIISLADETKSFNLNNINIHFVKEPASLNSFRLAASLIVEKIFEINPDIVHVHGAYLPYSLIVIKLKKISSFPIVLTVHSSIIQEINATSRFPRKQYLYCRSIQKLYWKISALNSADKIIVVSESLKKTISIFVKNQSKITVIMNGIDLNSHELNYFNSADFKNSISNSLAHPSILFVGRLVKVKGCDVLIQAIPLIKKSVPNVHLYIAGTGPQLTNLKLIVNKLNISNDVTFLGYVSELEKFELYKNIDLFVLPSYFEAFGITLLESMALGSAIVASNVGGVPEVVENGKTGLLFMPGDISDLSNKCINILSDDSCRLQMAEAGKIRVMSLFDYQKNIASIFNVYHTCLDKF